MKISKTLASVLLTLLISGCTLIPNSIPDLEADEVVDFINAAYENYSQQTQYVINGKLEGDDFYAEFDGSDYHIQGKYEGEDIDAYLIGADTYVYAKILEISEDAQWIKFGEGSEAPNPFVEELSLDEEWFDEENATDDEIKDMFEYTGKESCPDSDNDTCYKFDVTIEDLDEAKAYFDAKEKRIVQATGKDGDYEATYRFVYDNTIEVNLPAEAKDAVDYTKIINQLLDL